MGGIIEIAGSTVAMILGLCGFFARHWGSTDLVERHLAGKRKNNLDGVDPRGAFVRTQTPPFSSYPRSAAVPADGCEQKGREQRDAKDVKKNWHLCTRK